MELITTNDPALRSASSATKSYFWLRLNIIQRSETFTEKLIPEEILSRFRSPSMLPPKGSLTMRRIMWVSLLMQYTCNYFRLNALKSHIEARARHRRASYIVLITFYRHYKKSHHLCYKHVFDDSKVASRNKTRVKNEALIKGENRLHGFYFTAQKKKYIRLFLQHTHLFTFQVREKNRKSKKYIEKNNKWKTNFFFLSSYNFVFKMYAWEKINMNGAGGWDFLVSLQRSTKREVYRRCMI